MQRLTIAGNQQLPENLLDNTAGLFLSGDAGAGKSVFARQLHRSLALSGEATVIVLDPDNDLFEDCLRDLSEMPASVRQRAHAFFPANPKWPIGPINPLHVAREPGMSDYAYEARLECRVLHTSHLQLAAVNQHNFDGAARLFRWNTTINRSLARMGMTVPDAEHFFNVGSDAFRALVRAIPEPMAQVEFARLAAQKLDRQEEQIESTKNRFVAQLASPIMRAHLGAVEGTLPLRQLLQENALLYFNLSQGEEMLSAEAQSLLANLILSEILHTVFTTPRAVRKPVVVICDELPVFRSSAPMLAPALRRSRKLGFRFVGLAQGTQAFPEGVNDPLLHSMTSCCNSVIFRHKDPVDAEYFGKLISLPTRRADRVKFEHVELQQYQMRSEILTLVNRSFETAYADAEGESRSLGQNSGVGTDMNYSTAENTQTTATDSSAVSQTEGEGLTDSEQTSKATAEQMDQIGRLYGQSCNEAKAKAAARTRNTATTNQNGHSDAVSNGLSNTRGGSLSRNRGWNQEASFNRSRNRSGSTGISYSQQLVPVLGWRQIVRVELMTYGEQDQEKAGDIARLLTGQGIFYVAGGLIVTVQVQCPPDHLLETPKTAARLMRQLLDQMFAAPFYEFGEAILEHRKEVTQIFLQHLLERLDADTHSQSSLSLGNQPRILPVCDRLAPPVSQDPPGQPIHRTLPSDLLDQSTPPWAI